MKKALLVNKGWSDNLGDQVIKFSIEHLLEENEYEVDFFDFTQTKQTVYTSYKNAAEIEHRKEVDHSFKNKIKKLALKSYLFRNTLWYKNNQNLFKGERLADNYDLIIIGGGQLILGDSTFPFAMYLWVRLLKKRYKNARLIILGAGAGGSFKFLDKYLYKRSLKQFDKLYIRDHDSINLIKKNFNVESTYIPDVGFYVSKAHKLNFKKEKKVLIGITDFLVYKRYNRTNITEEDYYKYWEEKVINYINNDYIVELFYTTMRDLVQTLKLKQRLERDYNLNVNILYCDSLEELLNEVAKASILISGRMHGLIIGYAYDCEVIPFVISDKLKSFKEHYLDRNTSIDILQAEIENIIKVEINR
ncbi:polysaccharide pyruvyl transferase family protein [Cytobacillus oceanisediminis]|uniref:polysaccharide pyruvyl transferase family protein n=1 Tax=Cytobacillus oceanisediminis TaxID=665099 RepID=UPI001D139DF3|nr:polysaccharide pyruvyl transferase family protein [Cytobacillus oceanisediminis]MCC3648465.1 polysaccharide pyruvyl transferase family protein [Cytobacillus oceanisediminis]